VLNRFYGFILSLPAFKAKAKVESLFRRLLKPKASKVTHGLVMKLGFQLFDVEGIAWQPGQACVENNIWACRP
jgi:hypothetical protein